MVRKDNPANHKGSIIRWPKFKYVKNGYDSIDAIQDGWIEDILMEPMDYQIMLTIEHGPMILSAREAQKAEVIEANLWDDECEEKLKAFYDDLETKTH